MREPHDHRKLGELGGLYVDRAHGEPAGCAARAPPETESNRDHQDHGDQQEGIGRASKCVDWDVREHHEHDERKSRKDRLSDQKVISVAEHIAGENRAGAVNHHHAERDQPNEGRRKRDV
jgi:hypothetical protein